MRVRGTIRLFAMVGLLAAIALVSLHADAKGRGGGAKGSAPRTHWGAKSAAPRAAPKAGATAPKAAPPKRTTVQVKQHVQPSTGKVVPAHQRTAPNRTQKDNWSSTHNTNPNTGKPGTKTPTK